MTFYRVQTMDSRPGEFGPAYGDCWRGVMPDRRYTREATALRRMAEHAAALTAPAWSQGVTRVVVVDDDTGEVVRVVERRNHGAGGTCPHAIRHWAYQRAAIS